MFKQSCIHVIAFYFPKLTVPCYENVCTVVSWGQHANVPTSHVSCVMYVISIVIIVTLLLSISVVHHMGEFQSLLPPLNCFKMPWTDFCRSNFQDAILLVCN